MNSDPTAIRLDLAKNTLRIRWADGHESLYDGAYLRWICPCANCRGHRPGEVEPPTRESVRSVVLQGAHRAGSYALRFDFSDGHETGIYAFQYLREMCPSEAASP